MTAWVDRSIEEKALLNPAFCAWLIWNFAIAGEMRGQRLLTLAEAYLVIPIVLSKGSRESLPRSTRTSLAAWLDNNPVFQTTVAARTRAMASYTKEALIFGGVQNIFHVSIESITPNIVEVRRRNTVLRQLSPDTVVCLQKASFLGSWFVETGSANTVMALIGVQP